MTFDTWFTGVLLKWKVIVALPLLSKNESAGIPFTVKSLAWTVAGSTASVTLIIKSRGRIVTMPPQPEWVTEQDEGVAVALGVGVDVGVAVAVDVGVAVAVGVGVELAVGVGVGVPPAGPWIAAVMGEPVLKNPTVALALCGG
jgi:hypothetical protein